MNKSTLVPREELSDLDWLARNVHNWPAGHQGWCYVISNRDGTKGVATSLIGQVDCPWVRIEKQEWLTRRVELQNKPSWADAPSDMKWLAQDGDGQWYWYCSKPFIDKTNDDKVWDFGDSFDHEDCEFGEVLGDWRDTLEKRPEPCLKSMSGVHSDGDMIALHEELKDFDMNKFKPFTSIEDNQEKNMKQDNGWFERGELPPVGVKCETLAEPELQWVSTEVVAHRDGFAIVWITSEKCGAQSDAPKHFRPIRTEREELAELIESHRQMSALDVADAILATGFSLKAK